MTYRLTRRNARIDDRTAHEVRVVFAEDELAGVLVNTVRHIKVAKKRGAEQTGDIGVVHEIACVALASTNS